MSEPTNKFEKYKNRILDNPLIALITILVLALIPVLTLWDAIEKRLPKKAKPYENIVSDTLENTVTPETYSTLDISSELEVLLGQIALSTNLEKELRQKILTLFQHDNVPVYTIDYSNGVSFHEGTIRSYLSKLNLKKYTPPKLDSVDLDLNRKIVYLKIQK